MAQKGNRRIIRSRIDRQPQCDVGVDRIQTSFLQCVRLQLLLDTDTPSLLAKIYHEAGTGFADFAQGILKLVPTVASERTKHIAGYTFRMYSHDGYRVEIQSH